MITISQAGQIGRKLISFHGMNFGQINLEGVMNEGSLPGLGALRAGSGRLLKERRWVDHLRRSRGLLAVGNIRNVAASLTI